MPHQSLSSATRREWVSQRLPVLLLMVVLVVMSLLLLRDIGNPALGYPDADRIMMDGVFLLDFLRDLPFQRVYDYTIGYYGQYPALSIGYRPPFFPFIEALFNGALGVSTWSSRLAILAFALVGVSAWFALIRRVYDTMTAFGATLLLVTTPFIVQWGWYTMGEIPLLSMTMLTGYFFYRYTETEKRVYLFTAAILFGLTVWTKQTAIYLVSWFLLYLLVQGRLISVFRKRDTWIAVGLSLILLIPFAAITLWLGDQNLEQSVGSGGASSLQGRLHWDNLKIHLATLYHSHLTLPVLFMSLVGIIWSMLRKDRRALYFGLLVLTTYVFFSYIVGKNPRYPIFWIPAFTLFAVLPLFYLRRLKYTPLVGTLLLLGIAGFQIQWIYAKPVLYATGYDTAAEYVLSHSASPTVFFDGYNNGYFTYFMRIKDPARSMYVLRGDKLLTSSAISATHRLEVHAHSIEDIRQLFDQYGPELIVVESRDRSGIGIHRQLRDFLRQGPFTLVREIEVESTRRPLQGQTLRIYRYRDARPMTAEYLDLHLPVVGQRIRVPIRDLVHKKAASPP